MKRKIMGLNQILWILGLFSALGAVAGAQPAEPLPETLLKPFIEAIKQKRQTVKAAWENGNLDEKTTLVALGSRDLVSVGMALPSGDLKLADELVAELLIRRPQSLEKSDEWPERALIITANWLGSRKDARCLSLWEKALSRKTKRAPIWDGGVDASLYRMSEFYANQGQIEKALQTVERIYEYTSDPAMLANFEIHIARWNQHLGRQAKADEIYEQSEKRGDQRSIGVTRMDRSNRLFAAGRTEEARALLLQPIPGAAHAPIEVALLTRVALSYFADDDLENAQKYVEQALTLLKFVPGPFGDPYLAGFVPEAKRLSARIENRRKKQQSPFYWTKDDLRFYLREGSEANAQRVVLRFKTAPQGAVSFRCANPGVRIEPVALDAPGRDPLERVVFVSIARGVVKDGEAVAQRTETTTTLLATAADFPGQEARLPISIEVLSPIPAR